LHWGVSSADKGDPQPGSTSAASLAVALLHASETPGSPYLLQVDCTDQKGNRAFELFPGGAAIWNRRSQILLTPAARSDLLKRLLERGYPGFEDSYGGRDLPVKSAAPARISCSIRIDIQGLQKSSVQMAGGEQYAPLLELAAELLDEAERFAGSAVTPVDLGDALDKLSAGQLAPQLLQLRFLELPGPDNNEPGTLLRIVGGQLSRQAYRQGHAPEAPTLQPLRQADFSGLLAALQAVQLPGLPANLWSENQVELEVQVLAHKKVVLARRFSRLEANTQAPAQQRFDKLLVVLRELAD